MENKLFHLNNHTCESSKLSSSLSSSWEASLSRWPSIAHAYLALRAILVAVSGNNRTYVGILLISFAPFLEVAYRIFNPSAGTDYWNTYFFLYVIGSHLFTIATVTGLIFIPKKMVMYAAIIPLSYKFGKILWLATVTSNADFHRIVPWAFLLTGLSVSLMWIMCFDWLMNIHFHKREGTVDRVFGMLRIWLKMKSVPDDKAKIILEGELDKFESLKSI